VRGRLGVWVLLVCVVGAAAEATLPISKDNYFLGVRSYDRHGYRSPVAFPMAASE